MSTDPFDREPVTVVESHRRARVSAVSPVALPSGRFHDEGQIGYGGRSKVHQIFDKTLLRHSAMKVLSSELKPFDEDRQRFVEEAQITGQLDHPNVVPIHELSVSDYGDLYFTMKLVEGRTMEAMLRGRENEMRRFDWVAPFLEILIKVCDAVAFAHSRGVIHRDLKPGNIMVGSFGEVYVMDWGMARLVDGRNDVAVGRDRDRQSLDQYGDALGTPAYMSPEQAYGLHDDTDERSDVFALGATLYHIITGEPPYASPTEPDEMAAARRCAIRPAERVSTAARLPKSLSRIAMKAMSPDRMARYPTATALKEALLSQLRGGPDLPRCIFAPGDMVMREGEPADAAYIIVSGTCRVFKTINGEDVELRRLGPGEVFGETAILTGKPRTASVQAIDTLVMQVVTPEELEEGVGIHTGMGLFVRTLAERFREADERLTQLEASLLGSDP
jgi:eukaryotic-like serine/threonine-protein kinase